MKPTDEVRSAVNDLLIDIAQSQRKELMHRKHKHSKDCKLICQIAVSNTTEWKVLENHICGYSQTRTLSENNTSTSSENPLHPCTYPTPTILDVTLSDDVIRTTKGYDLVDLNLVCVHVRIGHSETIPGERGSRNAWEDLPVLWRFLKAYVIKGHHLYLATDSHRVRKLAFAALGPRLHASTARITHIDKTRDVQGAREGFKLTIVEQLLLATSCRVLVISKSNFSFRAAMLRRYLFKEKKQQGDLFMFVNGRVKGFKARYLYK